MKIYSKLNGEVNITCGIEIKSSLYDNKNHLEKLYTILNSLTISHPQVLLLQKISINFQKKIIRNDIIKMEENELHLSSVIEVSSPWK